MTEDKLTSMTASDAAASIGIELRGEDGQPFCCGTRMHVMAGSVGIDYAECQTCGNSLYRIDSPHTNGGYVLSEQAIERLGHRVWIAKRRIQPQKGAPHA